MSDKIVLTRNQLAKFLPTPEAIKAFENLFKLSTVETPADIQEVAIDSATASSIATEALNAALSAKEDLEMMQSAPQYDNSAELIALLNELKTIPIIDVNHTPTIDYIQFRNAISPVKTEGLLNWSKAYGHLQFTHIGGLVQELGLDSIAHVINNTGATISKGQVISYAGAASAKIGIQKFIANGTMSSLIIVGIASEDIANGDDGHATVTGTIRDYNASGSLYGETWSVGDVLYASPTTSGGLTKIKPTASNVCLPIAIVLDNSSTTGVIYVRTIIEQQLYYGSFSDSTDQTAAAINTAYALTFNTTATSNGISIGTPTSRIVATNSGLYEFSFSAQITSTSASTKVLTFWPRKNGTDYANSAMKASITGANTTLAISRSMFFSLNAGDYIEAMWATDDTGVTIESAPSTAFAPATPSVIMAVSQIAQ